MKFCGMTNLEDVFYSLDLGVDFIGFVFYKKSPRFIKPQEVKNILKQLPKDTKSVGVFIEENENEIISIMDYCGLKYAQVYNDLNIQSTIRAYRIKDTLPDKVYDGLILLDSLTAQVGGSAQKFDWSILEDFCAIDRAFIAGGVSLDNIEAIAKHKPYGVDLVSSLESFPGKKDPVKMKNFIDKLRSTK
ncbi:Phosphoribosylanthranilate isomerase [Desulfurella amilsii]|uniref:N-(5'-phosphoribosyl)anthranilate isomerase n=1 Tax=Desulfurella amilsii TaxID=1562698 RepID=A0A1X4XW39_9BACT|nr:Phosphoribosylanthranilate isomerase [Desulfurella amilsii]